MSYRNDHDAALNRVAALESELARMRAEREGKPEVPAKQVARGGGVGAAAAFAVLAVSGVAAWAWVKAEPAPEVQPAPVEVREPMAVQAPVFEGSADACMDAIDERAAHDAMATDPRGEAKAVAVVMRGSAVCHLPSTAGWASPEAEVINVTSLITVYYESNPYAMDNYASAQQLWREYHRARARRGDVALNVPKV
jgi:hypothetical protein